VMHRTNVRNRTLVGRTGEGDAKGRHRKPRAEISGRDAQTYRRPKVAATAEQSRKSRDRRRSLAVLLVKSPRRVAGGELRRAPRRSGSEESQSLEEIGSAYFG
jgi:hypothetical protein